MVMDKINSHEFSDRNNRLKKIMEKNNIDMLFIYGDDFHSANIRYLVDFWPSFENVLLILPQEGEIIIAGSPEIEYYKEDAAKLGKIVNIEDFIIEGEEAPNVETVLLKDIIYSNLKNKKDPQFGLVGSQYIPLGIHQLLLESIGRDKITDWSELLEGRKGLRAIKSENEIKLIMKAYKLSEIGMETAMRVIKDGIAEYEVAAEMEYVVRRNGAEGFAFDTMVASGKRSNTVVGRATDKVIEKGDLVMLAVGAKYEGYASSIGRPVYIGSPDRDMKHFLSVGVNAANLSEEKIVSGGPASLVDTVAREYIRKEGFGDYHIYSVGHGLGLHEVEEPFCTPSTDYTLVNGNVISIDIGLFGNPRLGGYRYEDGFYVCKDKAVALSSFQKVTF
jgi:Xaa-Pro aminopeptidase